MMMNNNLSAPSANCNSAFSQNYTPMSIFGNNLFMSFLNNSFLNRMFSQGAMFSGFNGFNVDTTTSLAQLKNIYNPQKGKDLANVAYSNAASRNTRGYCLKGVRTSLEKAGLYDTSKRVMSAYQAVGILSNNKNFKKVNVSSDNLRNLPAGCVVVWDRCAGHPHGHITVTLGDNKSASDHLESKVAQMHTNFCVFVPTNNHMNQTA